MAGGSAAGGRKISGAESNAFNQQSALLSQESARLQALQASLYQVQPQQFTLLGMNPQTGQPISPTDRGPAPTPVADPGAIEDYFTVEKSKGNFQKNRVATGKKVTGGQGKGNLEVRAPNATEIAQYNAKRAAYQNYQVAQKQYDEWTANSKDAWLQPQAQRRAENQTMQDVLAGRISGADATKLGSDQAQGAILAQLLQRADKALSPTGPMQTNIDTLLAQYQARISGRSPHQDLIDKFSNALKAGSPHQGLIDQFSKRLNIGLKGEKPMNPQIERELAMREDSMRNRMGRLLGPGWETSTPGIETLGDFGRQRADVIDTLNQQDIAQALQGYGGLNQLKSADTSLNLQGYGSLSQLDDSQKNQLLGHYLSSIAAQGTQLSSDLGQYTGLMSSTENLRMQAYINDMQRRTSLADLFTGTTTQPLTGVNFMQLAQAYGQQASAQTAAQQGGAGGGTNWGAIGSLAGTVIGGVGGSFFGPGGTMAGAALGGAVGGAAGGIAGGTGGGGGGGGYGYSPNPFAMSGTANSLNSMGAGYINPQGGTFYGNQGGYAMGNFGMSPMYGY